MGGGRGGAAWWGWLRDDERRRSGRLSGVGVSPSFRQALRPEASADFLLSATTLPAGSRCLPLDLTPVGSSLPPGGGGGGTPGKEGEPPGSSWPLLRPSAVPGAARPSRLVSHLPGLEADLRSHLRGPASACARLRAGPGVAEVWQGGEPWKAARPSRRGFVLPGSPPPPAACAPSPTLLPGNRGWEMAWPAAFTSKRRKLLRGNSAPTVLYPVQQAR